MQQEGVSGVASTTTSIHYTHMTKSILNFLHYVN